MEALSPWLKHPRRTIARVEGLMLAAAVLLLLQVFFGFYRRRWWRSSFLSTALRASSKIMEALIIYTLGTMQSSPIKNLSYPVWAVFLVMASAGTTAVQHYEFCDSFNSKYMEGIVDMAKYGFYMTMFNLLIDPNTYTFKAALDLQRRHVKNPRASSRCVAALFSLALSTKALESCGLAFLGYTKQKSGLFISNKFRRRTQAAETTEGTAADNGTSDDDSDPQSMKGYEYAVCYRVFAGGQITVDQIWDRLDGNSASLKDLCLSYALFVELKNRCFFGRVRPKTSSATTKDHDFVFKKLLPSEGDFRRAFRIIEAELGFCYDFFFTKYYYTFIATNLPPVPFLHFLVLAKTVLIFIVGVFAVRNSLVLETPNPIIEVQISRADYIISLLLLVVALVVELVHVAFYLASDWAQVTLAIMRVKKHWYETNTFGAVISFLRRVTFSGQLRRNRMKQYSVIEQRQEDPVEVSDAVKRAVARSLISTYGGNNPTNDDAAAVETWQWQDQMPFRRYSWALKGLSQLEVMLIWHVATEYCDISAGPTPSPSNLSTTCCAHLFANALGLRREDHRGVAVHLSRYYAYLIESVPELLPYHQADIAQLAHKVVEERTELLRLDSTTNIYDKMKDLQGTGEEDDPRKIFHKGVKLGKQLGRMEDGDHWEVLQDFWAKTTIHAAKSHYTTKQHMQHLESGGEFLTHIWALLAHAGILNLNVDNEDQEDKANLGSGPSAVV
eukprot:XP_008651982.2 uncharacterized protein LOC103631911 [Zea mays]